MTSFEQTGQFHNSLNMVQPMHSSNFKKVDMLVISFMINSAHTAPVLNALIPLAMAGAMWFAIGEPESLVSRKM
jgi:hypothetical protein